MKTPLHASVVVMLGAILAPAPDGWTAEKPAELKITVEGDWGAAPRENVEKLLRSAAAQLLRHAPERTLPDIVVSPSANVPITLFEKTPAGEFQVKLATRDLFWAQYVYQFAHELGHVLCNYEKRNSGGNHWFEEAVCETASLYALRRTAAAWREDPPYANWREFAPRLEDYANALLARRDRRLPPDQTMPQWYRARAGELRKQRHPSADTVLVAAYLLPLFEDEPSGWEAVGWLNLEEEDGRADFESYLRAWHGRASKRHRAFIAKVMDLFGFGRP